MTQERLNTWIYSLLWSGQGKCNSLGLFMLTASHTMLEVGEDLAWNLTVHQDLAAMFSLSFCRTEEGKWKEVVSSERASVSSPVGNSVLCLLPMCWKLALGIDCWRGKLLAACPQSGLWLDYSEGKDHSLNSSVLRNYPCSFQRWFWLGCAGKHCKSLRALAENGNGNDLMKKCKWMHD